MPYFKQNKRFLQLRKALVFYREEGYLKLIPKLYITNE